MVALELDRPTTDISRGAAMEEADFLAPLNAGAQAVDPATRMLMAGEMSLCGGSVGRAGKPEQRGDPLWCRANRPS